MTEPARAPASDPSPYPPTGSDASLLRFRAVLEAGLGALDARREEINEINVFPVADGDTGDNMVLTLRAVLDELDRLATAPPDGTIERVGRDEIVASVARAALLGARGNSGVILSQLIRGAAEELASRPGELVDPVLISAALARASDQAYGSVREPVEGTILTVVREMSAQVASETARMPDARLPADASAEEQNAAIARVIVRALQAGQSSVERGPELLSVLREAGVVDAGGYALTVFVAGIVGGLAGAHPPLREHRARARVTHPQHSSSTYRYCASFAVTGSDLEQWRFAPALERLGDSLLIVGDQATLRVHIHTDDPDAVTAVFAPHGAVSHLDVADMREQLSERGDRVPAADPVVCGAVAVATGAGMQSLFESLGVRALDGGPSLAPSSYDMLAAIHAIAAEQVVVLPNSPNALERGASRSAAVGQGGMRGPVAVATGRAGGRGGARPDQQLGPERSVDDQGDGARPHRRGRAGDARRRSGPIPRRRRGRVRRGGDRRLGAAPGGATRGARAACARRRADHLLAGSRSTAGRWDGSGACSR